jgi:hypothetical protein
MDRSLLADIDTVVGTGKAVVAGGDDAVVSVVKDAIESDESVSFYLTRDQARAVKEWYWTPERVRLTGIEPISDEESERIRSELGIDNITNFRYAPLRCECGHTYGAFDFLQQGIRQHGLDAVTAVFGLKTSTFFQVNPSFVPVCPECGRSLMPRGLMAAGGGWYDCDEYGGCCCCAALVFQTAGE